MKKTNLFKKMTSLFLAIMMLMSVVPMMASAEVSDGKFWQTVTNFNMDVFEGARTAASSNETLLTDSAVVNGRQIGLSFNMGGFWKYNNGNCRAMTTGDFAADYYLTTENVMATKPSTVGEHVMNVHLFCDSSGWQWTSPTSGWEFSNIWDPSALSVGDKVRVTADVYVSGNEMKRAQWNDGQWKQCWDAVAWTETIPKPSVGKMQLKAAGIAPEVDVALSQWTTVSYVYDITDENKTANTLSIVGEQPDDKTTENATTHMTRWCIGSIKVEVLGESNGSYTIEDGGEFTVIDTMDFDGLKTKMNAATDTNTGRDGTYRDADAETVAADEYIYNGWEYSNSKTLEDGRVQYVRGVAGESDDPLDNGVGGQRMGEIKVPGEWDNDARYGAALEDTLPQIAGTNSFMLSKRNSKHGKTPKPSASLRAYNIFDEADVQVGDTVKVTAWVYASNILQWVNGKRVDPTDAAPIDQTSPIDIRMWLSETLITDTDFVNYSYTAPLTDGTEQVLTTVVPRTWTPISFTYKVTEANKNISSIRIDGGADVEGQRYADFTVIAGIQTEKLTPVETEVAGRITGTVAAAPATVETGADYRVLVGAYKKVNGVYMMLGCNILPYEADCSYDFVINDAEGATDVFAYLWDFNAYEPQIVPIECTYIAQ